MPLLLYRIMLILEAILLRSRTTSVSNISKVTSQERQGKEKKKMCKFGKGKKTVICPEIQLLCMQKIYKEHITFLEFSGLKFYKVSGCRDNY